MAPPDDDIAPCIDERDPRNVLTSRTLFVACCFNIDPFLRMAVESVRIDQKRRRNDGSPYLMGDVRRVTVKSAMGGFLDKLSYARSLLVTAPLIFIYTGIMGSISFVSSFFDSAGRIQHACSRIWARMILRTSGVKLRVTGAENLTSNTPYVLCVNHQSHMDIPIVLAALPFQFRFAAKKELFRIPFLGWHLRRSGHVPIDRANPRAAVKSIRDAAARIRHGSPIVIFPEGGTSQDGSILPFKGGGFMLASQSMVDAVPVTIRGSRQVLVPRTYHVRSGVVEVSIGKPIPSQGLAATELANKVRQEIVIRFENGKTLDRHSYALSR